MTDKEIKTVDARGLSCPQPVLLTKNALSDKDSDNLKVLVDSPTAKENVIKYGRSQGFDVEINDEDDTYVIKMCPKKHRE